MGIKGVMSNNVKFRVSFTHEMMPQVRPADRMSPEAIEARLQWVMFYGPFVSPKTVCPKAVTRATLELDFGGEKPVEVRGMAFCSQADTFRKEIGRKRALTDALNGVSGLSKDDRRAVWEAYFARK